MTARQDDAWEFWQRSKKALDDLSDLMQQATTHIAHDNLPHHIVKSVDKELKRFQENFSCLVHAHKKAGR